ncbi:hypothetical protein E3N88_32087 [Mikania micrantha]|uniref:Uncharacterized protein n=1 Tax=Mikania micrantha TaxID=192012 RepID=A0A5N6MA53_9ASTR|nr:hypothetical protein E3N88_32087 [Mikania micrantha]
MKARSCNSYHITTRDECMLFQKGKRTKILAKVGKELEGLLRTTKSEENQQKQLSNLDIAAIGKVNLVAADNAALLRLTRIWLRYDHRDTFIRPTSDIFLQWAVPSMALLDLVLPPYPRKPLQKSRMYPPVASLEISSTPKPLYGTQLRHSDHQREGKVTIGCLQHPVEADGSVVHGYLDERLDSPLLIERNRNDRKLESKMESSQNDDESDLKSNANRKGTNGGDPAGDDDDQLGIDWEDGEVLVSRSDQ